MKPIGGYFELELSKGEEFHKNPLRLNTARNAFEYVLRAKLYKKVYLPYFTCEVMLEPINKLGLKVEFYDIDSNFKPIFDFTEMNESEVFLYTNYFGLCDNVVIDVAKMCKNLIIDNAQAFFAKPLKGVDTFYSPRKFFGLPDGAYLYTDNYLQDELEQDISYTRFEHLLGRIDLEAEKFYKQFSENDESFIDQPIKIMSKLTEKLLSSLDYESIEKQRRENFEFLHKNLSIFNKLSLNLKKSAVPMIYPFSPKSQNDLREKLISKKIFVAQYWPNVLEWADEDTNSYTLTNEIIALPIDQRYSFKELENILQYV